MLLCPLAFLFLNLSVLRKMIRVENSFRKSSRFLAIFFQSSNIVRKYLLENIEPFFLICRPIVLCNRTQQAIFRTLLNICHCINKQTGW